MAKLTVKKFDVLSVAKMYGVIGAIMGFFLGLSIAIGAGVGSLAASYTGMPMAGVAAGMGILAIFVGPIVYGIAMFVSGAVGAFIYNLVAERIGGIKIET